MHRGTEAAISGGIRATPTRPSVQRSGRAATARPRFASRFHRPRRWGRRRPGGRIRRETGATIRSVLPQPSQQRIAIGAKLRATRRAQGLTIAHVAAATGLTKGFISRIERDETSPSVATLLMVCEVLSLPIGRLFEAPEREVVRLTDAPRINLGGVGVVERMLSARSEPLVQVIRSTLAPGASGGPDLYTMSSEAEVVHVLAGALRLRFAADEMILESGDTLTFAGRDPHSWTNVFDGETEVVWVMAPAAWSGSS